MVTSWDIAREAGVSQATVSRVLNDDPRVASATRERVREVIDRLDYEPNAIARGLVTNRTNLVGVVVSDITNPFYPELLEAISQQLVTRNLRMILFDAWGADAADVFRLLLEQRVDGIIFTAALADSAVVKRLAERRLPLVLANRYVDGIACDSVRGHNARGAAEAADHLVELGHRRIAVIAGESRATTSRDRVRSFRRALRKRGVVLDAQLVRQGGFRFEQAREQVRDLLALAEPPTAIFCVNDLMAFAGLCAARDLGVSVPGRLSIIGFDDIPMAAWDVFRLTTVLSRSRRWRERQLSSSSPGSSRQLDHLRPASSTAVLSSALRQQLRPPLLALRSRTERGNDAALPKTSTTSVDLAA